MTYTAEYANAAQRICAPVYMAADAFTLPNKPHFHEWSGYTGMALENKWEKPYKKKNDLLFRCALIRAYIDAAVDLPESLR